MSQTNKEMNYTLTNFNKVRIVMVNTTEPGNIGAAARAMKNMMLSELYLVSPSNFPQQLQLQGQVEQMTFYQTLQSAQLLRRLW